MIHGLVGEFRAELTLSSDPTYTCTIVGEVETEFAAPEVVSWAEAVIARLGELEAAAGSGSSAGSVGQISGVRSCQEEGYGHDTEVAGDLRPELDEASDGLLRFGDCRIYLDEVDTETEGGRASGFIRCTLQEMRGPLEYAGEWELLPARGD